MRTADLSRREQSCLCAIAQAAKAARDLGKSQIDVTLDIFGKDPFGIDFFDDPLDLRPKVSRVVSATPLPREGEWLAGVAGSDDMNAAAPRSAVEGSQIVPYRRFSQGRVCHPRHESGRCMGFPLDVTHSAISGLGDVQAEVETAVSGAKGKAGEIAGFR